MASPPALAFTIATSDSPLTKTFTLGDDGKPRMSRGAGLLAGSARRVTLTGDASDMAEQLGKVLTSLSANEALIPAGPPVGRDVWEMATKSQAEGRNDVIARTLAHFTHAPGAPALVALDFDTKGYDANVIARLAGEGGLSKAMAAVFPPLERAARVTRRSVSSHIRHKDKPTDRGADNGQHHYYLAVDGADVADFARRLGDRLMLAGWCWGWVSESGRVIVRTLIDVTASSEPSRFFYEADGVLEHAEIEYAPGGRTPRVKSGGFLDTRQLPALSPAEREQLDAIKSAAKVKCAPTAEANRNAWLKKRGKELMDRGVAPELAQTALRAASDRHELTGEFPIHLDRGGVVTVREILAGGAKYNKATCADPLEPGYGDGRNLAIVYTDGRQPHVFSQAHGGIDYALMPDPEDFFEAIDGDWPEPIDAFGDGDPARLVEVPYGALPDVLDAYARDVAERMGAPPIFVAVGCVVVASAAIGGTTRIQPKANDTGWTEPPFLWGLLVEEPGRKKTPVMGAVATPLARLDGRRSAVDIPRRQAWDAENRRRKKDAPPPGPAPRVRRSVVDGFTVEALREILADNPKGVLVSADEVTGLIGGLDQYKAGGGSDRADLLKLMDGTPRAFDRVGRSSRVDCWGASVLAGIQPKKLSQMAPSLDPDGLLQRFIPVVGDNIRRQGLDRAPDASAAAAYESTITGLAEWAGGDVLGFGVATVTLSPGAQTIRLQFEQNIEALLDVPQMSAAWRGHLGKWAGLFARLLLVFHMMDNWSARGPGAISIPVSAETASRAARFANLLLCHAIQFYETIVGAGESGEAARQAAGIILTHGEPEISRRDLYEGNRARWRPTKREFPPELFDAMTTLGRMGWCKPVEGAVDTSGVKRWEINPKVYVRFKDRAVAEAERRQQAHQRILAAGVARRAVMTGGLS